MAQDPLAHWLITEAPAARDMRTALVELIEHIQQEGIPLLRVVLGLGVLHPEMMAATYSWNRGDKVVRRSDIPHGMDNTDLFRNSPFQQLSMSRQSVRYRLSGSEANVDLPLLEEIREMGGTDYLAVALPRSSRDVNRASFATDQEGGFTDAQVDRLTELRHYLAVALEIQGRARMTRGLLDLYLGTSAGPPVYGGEVRRGEGEVIHSVIFISDLRGFTKLSENLSLEFITAVLNDYFEAIIGPVHAQGGEVLKMIGDGVLAAFRIEDTSDIDEVCARAMGTAELAIANIRILNHRRNREGKPPLACGIGLHVGDAIYGNVGSHDRLDFTVIGPAVNLCARLESLAGGLGEEIICSAEFAAHSGEELRSLGKFELKNVAGRVEAFVPV